MRPDRKIPPPELYRRGFSFIELAIVILCLGLLASIAVPLVGDVVNESKIAKAQVTCQKIKDAILQFRQDLNMWPWNGSTMGLASGTSINCTSPDFGFVFYNITPEKPTQSSAQDWVFGGSDCSYLDLLANHLISNTPKGLIANAYATTGTYRWKGPYIKDSPLDPWGRPYIVSDFRYATGLQANMGVVVISAGPNGQLNHATGIYCIAYNGHGTTGPEAIFGTPAFGENDDIWVFIDCLQ